MRTARTSIPELVLAAPFTSRIPAYPARLLDDARGDIALDIDPNPTVVARLLCDLIGDAWSVEVRDNFTCHPAVFGADVRRERDADVGCRVAIAVNLAFTVREVSLLL